MTTYGTAEYWKQMYAEERERASRAEDAAYEQRERERHEHIAEQERQLRRTRRTAATWPEALKRQESLFQEAQDDLEREAINSGGDVDSYFGDAAAACRRAWHIYAEELTAINPELESIRLKIAYLEQQRRELLETVPSAVSGRLDAEAECRDGWHSVAKAFFDFRENETDLSRWLNW